MTLVQMPFETDISVCLSEVEMLRETELTENKIWKNVIAIEHLPGKTVKHSSIARKSMVNFSISIGKQQQKN